MADQTLYSRLNFLVGWSMACSSSLGDGLAALDIKQFGIGN
jgi:hypothetical protein